MDLLQIALVFLIILLAIFLSILGLQVFLILRDLKKSLNKIDLILGDVEKPIKATAELISAAESGVKAVKKLAATKQAKRFFKRRLV